MMGSTYLLNLRLLDKVVQRIRSFPQPLGMLRRRDIGDKENKAATRTPKISEIL